MIVDSSVLISFLTPEDANHAAAVRLLQSEPGGRLVIPDRVVEETLNVLAYKRGMAFAVASLEQLQGAQDASIRMTSGEEWMEVLRLMKLRLRKMSFADHLLVYLSKTSGEPVLSFDRQLLSELKRLK